MSINLDLRNEVFYFQGTDDAPVLACMRPYGAVDDYVASKSYASKSDWLASRAGVDF